MRSEVLASRERADFHATVKEMKESQEARRAARAGRRSVFEDDLADQAPAKRRPFPCLIDEQDTSIDNYEGPTGLTARFRTTGSVNAREITQKIQDIAPKIMNPGMKALAEKLGQPGRKGGSGREKAKFYRFVSDMYSNNPHAANIMMMPDLADRFREIARLMPDPENIGRIADIIMLADLWPASKNPEKFKDNLKRLLADKGVLNGVEEPRRGPKPPGSC